MATLRFLGGFAKRLREMTEFEANPGSQCGFCPWREQCPDAANVPLMEAWLEDEDEGVDAEGSGLAAP